MKCKFLLLIGSIGLMATSCIKEEGLFREADIKSMIIDSEDFRTTIFSTDGSNKIQLIVDVDADYTALAPILEISEGATVYPKSESVQDFTKDVKYTVTSEDGKYQKEYWVQVIPQLSLYTDFESWKTHVLKYPVYNDATWDSANNGVRWGGGGTPTENGKLYPTRFTDDAYKGEYAVLLETQKGVKGGLAGHKPIFAGSMFRGKFAINMSNHIRSAKFGILHPKELGVPAYITGYYKYQPGKEYQEFVNGEEILNPNRLDECDIYAVIFRITKGSDKTEFLYGDDVQIASNIVGRAVLEDRTPKGEYTPFNLKFVYSEGLDYENYDYKLAVVLSSSRRGDYFEGAIGSTLIVDELEVVCDKIKE